MTEGTMPEFNPSKDERVTAIKSMTEGVFTYLRANMPDNRERACAIHDYEQACMWAVKCLFTDPGKGH